MPYKSNRFQEIHDMLRDIERDLKSQWPIFPHENLEAGKLFLIHVLALAQNECVQQATKEFVKSTHPIGLSKVITTPPNYPLFVSVRCSTSSVQIN
jgi:hypothetical protein